MELSKYEQMLLEGWEDTHKKSQLTFWILLALKDSPKHMSQIKEFIETRTNNSISADDKSMYRALRRFHDAELVSFVNQKSDSGPDKKIYQLKDVGTNVLNNFIERNIKGVFGSSRNSSLFN